MESHKEQSGNQIATSTNLRLQALSGAIIASNYSGQHDNVSALFAREKTTSSQIGAAYLSSLMCQL